MLHNQYLQGGGEDTVVTNEIEILREEGHDVRLIQFNNEVFRGELSVSGKLSGAVNCMWSFSSAREVLDVMESFHPDRVHVHNTFPTASMSIYRAARISGAAVVQTLHNYRLLCPNALLFRDGHVCQDCLGKFVPWPGVAHACYRGSRSQSGVTAAMLTFHRARRTWQREVDRFIALTEFSRQKFIEGGLPADKIIVKPNFLVDDPGMGIGGDHFLFAGRLDLAKGIQIMLDAWGRQSVPPRLVIAGTGPLEGVVEQASATSKSLDYRGRLDHPDVLGQMQHARALVFPSLWYEAFPMTIVEAFGSGLPVIASNLGSMAEIVDDHRTGLLFEPGNAADLAAKVRWASEHPEKMREYGHNARQEYERKYTAELNYKMLMDIYQQAIEHRRTHPQSRWLG